MKQQNQQPNNRSNPGRGASGPNPNWPSKTGGVSGNNRGNNPPKSK